MPFKQKEVDQVLAATGRRCCICGRPHGVQVHHIELPEEGGTDDIDNAIPLCPNCHDEVHGRPGRGRTTRSYTAAELKMHRQRTIDQVAGEQLWAPGTSEWQEDRKLILFYAQCLDRPAFRTHFHEELSFSDFDKAMEDTVIALNTGYWRMRDGTLIERARGKVHLTHAAWRDKVDAISSIVEEIRRRFHGELGLDAMLMHAPLGRFRTDRAVGSWMDKKRQEAIEIMNSMLEEIGHTGLPAIDRW